MAAVAAEDFKYRVWTYDKDESDHNKEHEFKKGESLPSELVDRLQMYGPQYFVEYIGSSKKSDIEKPVKKEKKYTESKLFDLKKAEQVKILNDLGIEDIPKFEKDRVKLILESI